MDKILDELVKRRDITDIYLFSPVFLKKELEKLLSKEDKKKIKYYFKGNYTHFHPFQLLQIIQEKERIGWKIPLEEEARKILRIPIDVKERKTGKKSKK